MIQVPMAWGPSKENTGDGARVGILDTGIKLDHEDLPDPRPYCDGFTDYDTTSPPNPYACEDDGDSAWHPTHVSGVVLAEDNGYGVVGVAPGIGSGDLYVSRVIDNDESSPCVNEGIVESLEKLISYDFGIANMSFSCDHDPSVATSVASAWNNDILLVAAAGNGSGQGGYPASYSQVIGVSGVLKDSTFAGSGFHCSQATSHGYVGSGANTSSQGSHVSVSAPFWALSTSSPDYGIKCGTSQAAPHVTGVATILRGACPDATAEQVRDVVFDTALDRGEPGWDEKYGYGIVGASVALIALQDAVGC